ncbi:MAG: dephospho-CoA kinase [Candidatus Woesearchaeota archaeon]
MIIGITGSFGTGKTTVANIFSKHGFKIINVDKLYHGIYTKDKSLKNKLKKEFGTLDRNKIKKIVFKDFNKLKKLNKLTHPLIKKEIKNEVSTIIKKFNKKIINGKNSIENKDHVKIIIDAPLLLEAKATNLIDKIIVVKCNKKEGIKRALNKGKYSKTEIENIIKSQMPLKEKIKYADFVVDNSGTIKETKEQIKEFLAKTLKTP